VDNCIEAGRGELLTDAVVDFSQWTAIVYGPKKVRGHRRPSGEKAEMGDLLSNPDVEIFELHAGASGANWFL